MLASKTLADQHLHLNVESHQNFMMSDNVSHVQVTMCPCMIHTGSILATQASRASSCSCTGCYT